MGYRSKLYIQGYGGWDQQGLGYRMIMVLQRQGRPWAAQSLASVLSALRLRPIPWPAACMASDPSLLGPWGQRLFSHTNSKWKSKLQCEGNFMIFKILLEPSVLKVNHQLWWFCYCKKILKVTYLTVLLPLASKFCNLKDISLGRGSKMYFN